jgi:hypothetical protein
MPCTADHSRHASLVAEPRGRAGCSRSSQSRDLRSAVALERDGDDVVGRVHEGWDVFGVPHGGYLVALAGHAVLTASGAPDLFTVTTHFLRKARHAPIRFRVARVGGSRQFTTLTATATQGDEVVLAVMASVGDRDRLEGPSWRRDEPWTADPARLTPRAGSPEMRSAAPGSIVTPVPPRARGNGSTSRRSGSPAAPPTVELTAHVRARTGVGPLSVRATSRHVTDGFLEEDALVHDAEGRLMVQSRQLARWTA